MQTEGYYHIYKHPPPVGIYICTNGRLSSSLLWLGKLVSIAGPSGRAV